MTQPTPTRVSLARLCEMVTETQEEKPGEPSFDDVFSASSGECFSPQRYWKLVYSSEEKWHWVSVAPFTADEGAILRLIWERQVTTGVHTLPKSNTIQVSSYHSVGDKELWNLWKVNNINQLAPALCCVLLFALKGERVEVEEDGESANV